MTAALDALRKISDAFLHISLLPFLWIGYGAGSVVKWVRLCRAAVAEGFEQGARVE